MMSKISRYKLNIIKNVFIFQFARLCDIFLNDLL